MNGTHIREVAMNSYDMRLTQDEQNALAFAHRYHGWHTYAQDRRTAMAIGRLAIKGLVIVNQYRQFTLASQLLVN
jgi:hypothetical protein